MRGVKVSSFWYFCMYNRFVQVYTYLDILYTYLWMDGWIDEIDDGWMIDGNLLLFDAKNTEVIVL